MMARDKVLIKEVVNLFTHDVREISDIISLRY